MATDEVGTPVIGAVYQYHAVQWNGDGWRYFYSLNPNEDRGWTLDGPAFYALTQSFPGAVAVYQYHAVQADGDGWRFFYSTSSEIGRGWTLDGPVFYVFPESIETSVPIYQYHAVQSNGDGWRYFYSKDPDVGHGWTLDGPVWNAFPTAFDSFEPPEFSTVVDLTGAAYVDFGSSVQLPRERFTIAGWVRFHDLSSDLEMIVSRAWNVVFGVLGGNRLYASLFSEAKNIQGTTRLTTDRWYYVALTYDGTSLRIYVDGALDAEGPFTSVPPNSNPLQVGALNGGNTLHGDVWDLALWSTARSAEQLTQDMWRNDFPECSGIVAYYDLHRYPAREATQDYPIVFSSGARSERVLPGVRLTGTAFCDPSDESDLNPGGSDPYTIDAWVYLDDVRNRQVIFANGEVDGESGVALYVEDGVVKSQRGGPANVLVSGTPVAAGQWYNLVTTYDGVVLTIYINGTQDSSGSFGTIPPLSGGEVLIGAGQSGGAPGLFLQGYIQFLSVWTRALDQGEVQEWMYNDPTFQSGLAANFDFAIPPARDLTDGHAVSLENGATVTTLRIPLTGQSFYGRPSARRRDRNVEESAPTERIPAEFNELAHIPEVIFTGARPFSEEHQQLVENEFLLAIPPEWPRTLRRSLEQRYRYAVQKVFEQGRSDPASIQAVPITLEEQDGKHVLTHHTPSGPIIVFEAPVGTIDPCVLWWVTFDYTLLAGFAGLFGFPTPTTRVKEFAMSIIQNPAVQETLKSLVGGTMSALTILSFMRVLYDFGLLKKFLWFCLTTASWWALARFVVYVIGLFAPVTTPQKALFIANAVVLVGQLAYQITEYQGACGSSVNRPPGATGIGEPR